MAQDIKVKKFNAIFYDIIFLNDGESNLFGWGTRCDIFNYNEKFNWIKNFRNPGWTDHHQQNHTLVRLK